MLVKILFLLFWVFSVSCQHQNELYKTGDVLSVIQGPTSHDQTQINILAPKNLELNFEVWLGGTKIDAIREKKKIVRDHSDFAVYHLYLNHLKLDQEYRITILNQDDFVIDERFFKTLDPHKMPLKIALASCMNDVLKEIGDIAWPNLVKQNPDVIFLIGDNVYADVYKGIYTGLAATPEHLWNRHVDTRNTLKLAKEKRLIPIYVTWDDHDFGVNDSNKHYVYKNDSIAVYKTFFPQDKVENYESIFGVGGKLRLLKFNFYFLDNRSFRDPAFADPGSHFGHEQEQWLFQDMLKSKGDNIIISGDQFFGGYHNFESFEKHHAKNFSYFLDQLKKDKDRNIFISGDRHLFELMEIKKVFSYKTYEITTSGIHAMVFEGALKRDPNPRRIAGKDATYNFMTLEFSKPGDLEFNLKAFDHLGNIFHQQSLIVK